MKKVAILGVTISIIYGCGGTKTEEIVRAIEDENPRIELGTSTLADADYWYRGTAEITSYKLSQARYGELHEGTAVLIFVTEPFSVSSNTKADEVRSDNESVLKLNQTLKFNTGIYPYTIMTSSFFPFKTGDHSLKVSSSSQEWCGHTYMELRKKKSSYEVDINSYFEGESVGRKKIETALLEDDLLTMIRIRKKLPQGKNKMYISMVAARLLHKEYKPYACELTLTEGDKIATYTIHYPALERTLSIQFEMQHPYKIIGWEETSYYGAGTSRKKLTTKAERMKSINSPYWTKNSSADSTFRKELNL